MTETHLLHSIYKVILRRELLPWTTGLVVGVSGGTDSLALMHLLATVCPIYSISLHVATLDHGLRVEAGADDARFVAETAQSWGLPVTSGYTDVRALAQQRQIGIEAAARLARYEFLASVADARGASRIAVAHNADDQVETVLFHILRGAGLTGLGGMAYVAPLLGRPDLTLIRPLLDVPRTDLDAYCRELGLQPRHDASNEDVTYTRNRLRHQIIPYLREISPQIERNLRQLADIAHAEDDFADIALHQAIDSHITQTEGRIRLPRNIFEAMHPALQRRFVRWAARECGSAHDVSYIMVDSAVSVAHGGQVGAQSPLKGDVRLRIDYDHSILIEHENAPFNDDLPLLPGDAPIIVLIPGETKLEGGWSLVASLIPLDLDSAGLRLAIPDGKTVILRGRREGERFAPRSLRGHTQKVSKWMINYKVPHHLRERLPLLVVDDQIAAIWWKDWDVGENFSVNAESQRVVYFKLNRDFRLD